jgi:hypothetical protein
VDVGVLGQSPDEKLAYVRSVVVQLRFLGVFLGHDPSVSWYGGIILEDGSGNIAEFEK